jgi:mycofactocin precursor
MVPGSETRAKFKFLLRPVSATAGPPLVLWHSVSLSSELECQLQGAEEAVMTEQAVMEPATAVAEPEHRNLVAGDTGPVTEDEALVAEELLVEEVSIDGMCGVY